MGTKKAKRKSATVKTVQVQVEVTKETVNEASQRAVYISEESVPPARRQLEDIFPLRKNRRALLISVGLLLAWILSLAILGLVVNFS